MGSGVLLAALVVLWFVVLVPMVVTRGDAHATAGAADSGRTLQRRRPVDPVVHAETERVSIDRAALVSSGELRVDVHAVRRRTLAGLVALAVLALVGALTYRSWLWAPQLLLDVAVVGYLMVIKAAADRERRAAARRHARLASRARLEHERPVRRPAERPVAPAPRPAPVVAAPTGPIHPSLPLAPVHPLRPGRVVAARVPVAAGWQQSAVVGLDDEDMAFAEIDEYRPARVVNG
ncbi:divisome protein SepX/GlpR [Modestobacter versicolor]|uniref:divisome protein SepX/GlpR n=1 Tax=Modestobacter versicolor TaxID=429133 RepID=UPI0034DF49F3